MSARTTAQSIRTALGKAARTLFRGFLKGAKTTGKGLKIAGVAIIDAHETSIVTQVSHAEERLAARGSFGSLFGVLFGDANVLRDVETVNTYGDYARRIQARRSTGRRYATAA